jgi:hypothetical protein
MIIIMYLAEIEIIIMKHALIWINFCWSNKSECVPLSVIIGSVGRGERFFEMRIV